MTNNETRKRENDALQSGEDDRAFGQDERDLGAGGQTETKPIQGHPKDREPSRDQSLNQADGGKSR